MGGAVGAKEGGNHPTMILMKLDRVFWVETTMHSTSKMKRRGLEPGMASVEWIQACKQ